MSTETAVLTTVPNVPLQHFVLDGVNWEEFIRISDALGTRPLRLAYDGNRMEFMTKSHLHERRKKLLGQLVERLSDELDIPRISGGEMTIRHGGVQRGMEPDQCYWIQHAEKIADIDEWDAAIHPPPDLAIEIDVAHSSVDRQAISARLGIPELWRFDGQRLQALVLNDSGEYDDVTHSLAFPFLNVADLTPFLMREGGGTETQIMRAFADWVREQGFGK